MKRVLCLLLAVLLLFCLMSSVGSASEIYLVAINDSLPFSLSSATMPFYSNGTLYLPQSVFDSSALGVAAVYSSANKTLSLTDQSGHQLVYYLASGTAVTEDGNSYTVSATLRNGTVFVPATYTMQYFGCSVSTLTSQNGRNVIRITTGSQVYDDELFLQEADNMIEYRVSQYLSSTTDGNSGPPPSVPSVPDDTPERDETAPTIYLAFTGTENASILLSELKLANRTATFFLTEEELAQNPTLVLEIAANGHRIGIRLTGEEADPAAAVDLANDHLDQILKAKTLLILAPAGSVSADMLPGYVVIRQATRSAATAAAQENISLLVCSSTGRGVTDLYTLIQAGCTIRPVRETSQFLS